VHASDFFPADTGLRPSMKGSALPISTIGIEHSHREFLVVTLTTLQRSLYAAAPSVARPLDQSTSTRWPGRRVLILPGLHAQGSPPERAGYDYLGTSDNSQDGTLTRWIDAVTGCTIERVEPSPGIGLGRPVERSL
jgi:hypothetical protein